MNVSQVRRGFKSLEEAQLFTKRLANPEQYEIEKICEGFVLDESPTLAYCVIPKNRKECECGRGEGQ